MRVVVQYRHGFVHALIQTSKYGRLIMCYMLELTLRSSFTRLLTSARLAWKMVTDSMQSSCSAELIEILLAIGCSPTIVRNIQEEGGDSEGVVAPKGGESGLY